MQTREIIKRALWSVVVLGATYVALQCTPGCVRRDRPLNYWGPYAGKCWNYDSIQKLAQKKGICGHEVFFNRGLYKCTRSAHHGGLHHSHDGKGNCVATW